MNNLSLKGSPQQGLIGATLGFFFGFAAVALYGPTAQNFQSAMDLTPAMVGFLVSIPSLSGSLLRIPFGAWVDNNGGKKPVFILLLISLIGLGGITFLLNTAYPDNMKNLYWLVLLFGCLSGCGIATFSPGNAMTSYWFPQKKQGLALAVYAGIGNLAPGFFSFILPLYLHKYGFISAYVAWTIFLAIGVVLFALVGVNAWYFQLKKKGFSKNECKSIAQSKGEELFPSGTAKQSLIQSAKVPNTWALVILYFATFGGFLALTAWFPTYWIKLHGYTVLTAGMLTGGFSILASAIRIPGGSIADKIGGEKLCLISMYIMLIAAILLTFTTHTALAFIAAILMAIAMGFNNAAVFKLVPTYVPIAVGGASGWVGGLGAFGGFVIPPIMGSIVSLYGQIGYVRGFFVFIILAIINIFILYLWLMRYKAKQKAQTH